MDRITAWSYWKKILLSMVEKCGIKDKMKGGWEEAWPKEKKNLTVKRNALKLDKKLYKEMKKKGAWTSTSSLFLL